jgi:hypothetical protein
MIQTLPSSVVAITISASWHLQMGGLQDMTDAVVLWCCDGVPRYSPNAAQQKMNPQP